MDLFPLSSLGPKSVDGRLSVLIRDGARGNLFFLPAGLPRVSPPQNEHRKENDEKRPSPGFGGGLVVLFIGIFSRDISLDLRIEDVTTKLLLGYDEGRFSKETRIVLQISILPKIGHLLAMTSIWE